MAEVIRTRYPGPHPFGDDPLSRKLFHGRDQESLALTHQIRAHRLVVLYARSGLGKTSLLRAGVAQHLRDEGLVPLIVHVGDGEEDPFAGIYREVEAECVRQGVTYSPGDKSNLWSFFKTAEFWSSGDVLLDPVLVIDQFEEIFTLHSAGARRAFIDQLSYVVRGVRPALPASGGEPARVGAGALSDTPPPVRIVFSIREEFLPNLEELSDRITEILDQRFRLLPLSRASATRAIQEPSGVEDGQLETPSFTLDDQAREEILRFLEGNAEAPQCRDHECVEPFLLQLICRHVEQIAKQKAGAARGRVTVSLEEIGGRRGLQRVLSAFYTQQLAVIPPFERHRVKRLCSQFLISWQGLRLRQQEGEIFRLTRVKQQRLRGLVGSRLLRVDRSVAGSYYELSHDSLISPILNSRRPIFWLRTISLVAGVALSVSIAGLLAVEMATGRIRLVVPGGDGKRDLLLGTILVVLVGIGATLYVVRTWPLLREMWRRLAV